MSLHLPPAGAIILLVCSPLRAVCGLGAANQITEVYTSTKDDRYAVLVFATGDNCGTDTETVQESYDVVKSTLASASLLIRS